MILLKTSLLGQLESGNVQSVCDVLQSAVELEHSTIPLYLYALYSLDTAKNALIADIIQSVVVEEMLHMTLACNVLNALGGSPQLDQPGFIPPYPGPLPGGVESQLTVHLAPFSSVQLETFLTIEQPETPLEFKALPLTEAVAPVTIGEFYQRIEKEIVLLGDGAFVQPPRHQIGSALMPESVIVTDVATARQALQTIIDQGEGTSTSPMEIVGDGYAHYYRYMEIKKGRRLVKMPGSLPPDQQYTYSGDPVPFDPSGVYPVPTDPKAASYPTGSAARFACDNFNYTYTSLLKTLHAVFNGEPERFNAAIGLMMSLKGQARNMMSGIPNPALNIGPSFEYLPVNP